jgi:hypothetical protein
MASPNPDDLLLLIRCPSCGQRFKVGEDLRERTVECGGCESRFRINEEVIIRGRKVYPGERKAPELNRFQRVPLPGGEKLIGVQPMRYTDQPDPAVLEPMSPQRIMAGGVGVAGMAITALLLMFGGGSGGLLDGMDLISRLMIAGFAVVLGIALLLYANPKARKKSAVVGLAMGSGVMALPFFFTAGLPIAENVQATRPVPDAPVSPIPPSSTESPELVELREQIGTMPLTDEIARLARENQETHAIGLWLRNMSEANRYLIMDYIVRVSGADPRSHFYPRGDGNFLLVVTGITASIHDLADMARPLGDIAKIYPELSIIEVKIRPGAFVEGPLDKLSDKGSPDFYELNKQELECIDLGRIKRAVQRLAEAEPKIYRADISRRLLALLDQSGIDFKGAICVALLNWAEQPGVAGAAALNEIEKLAKAGKPISTDLVRVAVQEKNTDVIPFLDELWFKDPQPWEMLYGELGAAAEPAVLARFPQTEGRVRYSAARLLGRVGTANSLAVLEGATATHDTELKIILEQSRKAIVGRSGE